MTIRIDAAFAAATTACTASIEVPPLYAACMTAANSARDALWNAAYIELGITQAVIWTSTLGKNVTCGFRSSVDVMKPGPGVHQKTV